MRRDTYLQNDSGGLSVVAADALDAIIGDGRANDVDVVGSYKALLLELYGDDSMPVRVVVDEPLQPEEEAQWLARASYRLDTADGRLLVMGGFDPDIMRWWKDETGGQADGRGVAIVHAMPGSLRVDVYAHVGSMNGRRILSEADERPGAAFRRSHPGRPFPLWLANMLDYSGEDDLGHEGVWRDVRGAVQAGELQVDVDGAAPIGFLVHVTRHSGEAEAPPDGGWFDSAANVRIPTPFPLGLPSEALDPNIESLRDRLLDRQAREVERPIATAPVDVVDNWSGEPLQPIAGPRAVAIAPTDAFLLHWMAALTSGSPPRFQIRITAPSPWALPSSTPDFAVVPSGPSVTEVGPAENMGGWWMLWTARDAAQVLSGVPDGSTVDMAIAPDVEGDETDPAVGRARYRGTIRSGKWQVAEASPRVDAAMLKDALAFVRRLVEYGRIPVQDGPEREAFEEAAGIYSPEEDSLVWNGSSVGLAEPEERTLILLAGPVFQTRFGHQWPVDRDDDDEDDEG